jgi:tRNA(Ile)-lysidine synthase
VANVPDDRRFDPDELADLFRPLESSRGLVIAVSGGSDSTALLHLIARWHRARVAKPPLIAVTIDHALRPDSAAEAATVAQTAAALRIPHHILRWDGQKPTGNLQSLAREARYALLAQAARESGADTVVTAHTEDDQAETFLLALQRGSSVYGLAGMRLVRAFDGLKIARPLLSVTRERLRSTLRAEAISWIEDPSNANDRFARVRLRQNKEALVALGLSAQILRQTATRLARAADALDIYIDRLIARTCHVFLGGIIRVDLAGFTDEPAEVRLRAMARLLAGLSGAAYVPRFERLERFAAAFEAGLTASRPMQRTLGSVTARLVIRKGAPCLWLFAEEGRCRFSPLVIRPGEIVEWDRRIRVSLSQTAHLVEVRALGAGARQRLGSPEAFEVPSAALATLPALWTPSGEIVAIFGLEPAADPIRSEIATAISLVPARIHRPDAGL